MHWLLQHACASAVACAGSMFPRALRQEIQKRLRLTCHDCVTRVLLHALPSRGGDRELFNLLRQLSRVDGYARGAILLRLGPDKSCPECSLKWWAKHR